MLNSLHRHIVPGTRQGGGDTERLARLSKILACGVAAVAAAYFALLYLVVGR